MSDRLTKAASLAIAHAQQEVFQFSHDAIGPEHLLLGILYEMDPVAIGALQTHGITYASARTAVAQIVGAGTRDWNTTPPFTPAPRNSSSIR
jgi:ATP-dependent Clp protease ATP-binding subunit ClpC